jgi:hypothetical protein
LFEVNETIRQVLTRNLIALLDEYGFFFNYIKNKVANLNVMTMALKLWLVVKFWV